MAFKFLQPVESYNVMNTEKHKGPGPKDKKDPNEKDQKEKREFPSGMKKENVAEPRDEQRQPVTNVDEQNKITNADAQSPMGEIEKEGV